MPKNKLKTTTLGNYRKVTKEERMANKNLAENAMIRDFAPDDILVDKSGNKYQVSQSGAFTRVDPKPAGKKKQRILRRREAKNN